MNVDQSNVTADAPKKIESTPGKMTKIQCELCGSTDIMKEEGFFVCQHCGCKYSLEEARKMMIEGKVDVSGSTVKIDTERELKNLLQSIKGFMENGEYENLPQYLKEVLAIEANNSDIDYIQAVINKTDAPVEKRYLEKARQETGLGIFTEDDYNKFSGVEVEVSYKRSAFTMGANEVLLVIDCMKPVVIEPNKTRFMNISPGSHSFYMETQMNHGPYTVRKTLEITEKTKYITLKNPFSGGFLTVVAN